MAYILNVKIGEPVSIDNGRIVVVPEAKSGQRVRLRFEAATNIKIEKVEQGYRRELKPLE